MFDNIGGKIKGVAKVVTWLGIIGSCLAGFVMLVEGVDGDEMLALYGILLAGLGSLFSWLGSLTLYGFGQLIENSDLLVEQGRLRQMNSGTSAAPATPAYTAPAYAAPVAPVQNNGANEATVLVGEYSNQCTRCGTWQSKNNLSCTTCGAVFTNRQ